MSYFLLCSLTKRGESFLRTKRGQKIFVENSSGFNLIIKSLLTFNKILLFDLTAEQIKDPEVDLENKIVQLAENATT